MNEVPNENMSESTTPSESRTVLQQASCHQSNWDDCKQQLLDKWYQLTALDPVDTCFMDYMKQQMQSKTRDPNVEFLQSTPRHEINDC
jgi:hypothetical protein